MSAAWVAGVVAIVFAAGGEPERLLPQPAMDAAPPGARPQPAEVAQDVAGLPEEDEEEETALVRAETAVRTPEPTLPHAPGGRPLAEGAPVVLQRIERPDGSAIERVLEPSGDVVLHEVTRAGTVVSCAPVGRLSAMRVVEQRDAAGGEVVQVVRDTSGVVLRYVVGTDGEARALTVVAPAR